jgi:hypothetical protein
MTSTWWRHVAPPERQHQGKYRTDTTTYSNDRRRTEHQRRSTGGHESGALADDHPHVG